MGDRHKRRRGGQVKQYDQAPQLPDVELVDSQVGGVWLCQKRMLGTSDCRLQGVSRQVCGRPYSIV